MKFNKDTFDIIFFARGGQGAKVAAEIVAQAASSEGKYVQAFPNFGPERSGAPTKTFVRISDFPIRTAEPVLDPDVVLVFDETILTSQDVTRNLDCEESLIVNSKKSPQELGKMIALNGNCSEGKNFKGKIYAVDATGISLEIIGQPRPNTVILGKLIQITEAVKLENITDEFRKIFLKKIGKQITEKNIQAIKKAYDSI